MMVYSVYFLKRQYLILTTARLRHLIYLFSSFYNLYYFNSKLRLIFLALLPSRNPSIFLKSSYRFPLTTEYCCQEISNYYQEYPFRLSHNLNFRGQSMVSIFLTTSKLLKYTLVCSPIVNYPILQKVVLDKSKHSNRIMEYYSNNRIRDILQYICTKNNLHYYYFSLSFFF